MVNGTCLILSLLCCHSDLLPNSYTSCYVTTAGEETEGQNRGADLGAGILAGLIWTNGFQGFRFVFVVLAERSLGAENSIRILLTSDYSEREKQSRRPANRINIFISMYCTPQTPTDRIKRTDQTTQDVDNATIQAESFKSFKMKCSRNYEIPKLSVSGRSAQGRTMETEILIRSSFS